MTILQDQEFPDNVADALAQLQPTIDLDENGGKRHLPQLVVLSCICWFSRDRVCGYWFQRWTKRRYRKRETFAGYV